MPIICTEYQLRTAHNRWVAVRWTPEGLLVHRNGEWELPAHDQNGIARSREWCDAAVTARPDEEVRGCACPNVQPRTAPPTWPEGDARDAIDELNTELERLTGCRYVPDMAPLGEWMSSEQVKALGAATLDSGQLKAALWLAVQAARAAYEKGRQAGQGPR